MYTYIYIYIHTQFLITNAQLALALQCASLLGDIGKVTRDVGNSVYKANMQKSQMLFTKKVK